MNISRYDRKTFRGFMYYLWLIFLRCFGVDVTIELWKQKTREWDRNRTREFWEDVLASRKGRSGSPRFKGYKE